ncbi:MAG: hypothetical protein M1818_008423 [Claussenomyces sp. TS43310]|nr:MAG: hypothetical protein M1818_008423 [Claussenomyces sp. TS43310]
MAGTIVNPSGNESLLATTRIPIAQLDPSLSAPSTKSIKALVTLIWPYSSTKGSITVLLAEPDFRFRRAKGQVRAHFAGSSGREVVKAKVGSGDEVLLSLDGAEWIKDGNAAQTPGRSIDWELKFSERLLLQIQESETQSTSFIDIDFPKSLPEPKAAELASNPISVLDLPLPKIAIPRLPTSEITEWSSPAFVKRARVSYGSLFGSGYNPLADDDETANGRHRKRARFGRESGAWKYSSRSPSPDISYFNDKSVDAVANPVEDHKAKMMDEGCQTVDLEGDAAGALADMSRQSRPADIEVQSHPLHIGPGNDADRGVCTDEMPSSPPMLKLTVASGEQENPEDHPTPIPSTPVAPISPTPHSVSSDGLPLVSPLALTRPLGTFHKTASGSNSPENLNDKIMTESRHDESSSVNGEEHVSYHENRRDNPSETEDALRPYDVGQSNDLDQQGDWHSMTDTQDQGGPLPYVDGFANERTWETSHEPVSAPDEDGGRQVEQLFHNNVQASDVPYVANQTYPYPRLDDERINNGRQMRSGADVRGLLYPHNFGHSASNEMMASRQNSTAVDMSSPQSSQSQRVDLTDGSDLSEDGIAEDIGEEHQRTTEPSQNEDIIDDRDWSPEEEYKNTRSPEEYIEDEYDEEYDEEYGHGYSPNYTHAYEDRSIQSEEENEEAESELDDQGGYDQEDSSDETKAFEVDRQYKRGSPEVIDLLSDSDDDDGKSTRSEAQDMRPSAGESHVWVGKSEMIREQESLNLSRTYPEVGIDPETEYRSEQDLDQTGIAMPQEDIEEGRTSPQGSPENGDDENLRMREMASNAIHHHADGASMTTRPELVDAAVEHSQGSMNMSDFETRSHAEHDEPIAETRLSTPQVSKQPSDMAHEGFESTAQAQTLPIAMGAAQAPASGRMSSPHSKDQAIELAVSWQSGTMTDQNLESQDVITIIKQLPTPGATQVTSERAKDYVPTIANADTATPAKDQSVLNVTPEIVNDRNRRRLRNTETILPDEVRSDDAFYDDAMSLIPRALGRPDSTIEQSSFIQNDSSPILDGGPITSLGYDGSAELALDSMGSPSKETQNGQPAPDMSLRLRLTRSLRSSLGDFTLLKVLRFHMEKRLDVLAIVTTKPPDAERAKTGPRQYHLRFNITDASIAPSSVAEAHIFRQYKDALPVIKPGDGIILRHFNVKPEKGRGFTLRSNDESSWAVFSGDEIPQIRGPPLEFGEEESQYLADLRTWFQNLDPTSKAKLDKANTVKQSSSSKGRTIVS